MLTVQPNIANNYKQQSFMQRMGQFSDYTPYEEVVSDENYYGHDGFDLDFEKEQSKHELDLWKQTQHNLSDISKTTDKVPVLSKGTKILSGLISVAIGWGGLRWASAGTLEVLSKIGKTKLAQTLKGVTKKGAEKATKLFKKGLAMFKNSKLSKTIAEKFANMKIKVLGTKTGKEYTVLKNKVKGNEIYQKALEYKNQLKGTVKNLNPKRIFIEAMGVAGGTTAAVKALGGQTIDGANHLVEKCEDGGYIVDGNRFFEEYGYAS